MSMDALEFLRERKRMCNLCKHCEGCPLERAGCGLGTSASDEEYEKIIAAVEQWAKENPRKTRQSVFLEQYPEARIRDDGVLQILPCSISASHRNARGNCVNMRRECPDCRREFWTQEVE
jgi:hypothetical protein